MSLALIQSYSSAEEEEDEPAYFHGNSSDEEDGDSLHPKRPYTANSSLYEVSNPSNSSASGLPSAFDAFSEVSGPPDFLNNCVQEVPSSRDSEARQWGHGRRRQRKEKKDLPAGAVMEAKAQLVGIHEQVRSDIEGSQLSTPSVSLATKEKRVATATNPNAEDAAELLRMCLQCGVPKTYSNERGMVCPVCRDHPATDPSKEPKKKGSSIKEKEKNKRMKGQSSHATWKSETEMQLRQQFD